MPAASWRIIPARSISRCEAISASFGFSFRMGRKNRDKRMGKPLRESMEILAAAPVKPDRGEKHKAGIEEKPLSHRILSAFLPSVSIRQAPYILFRGHVEIILERNA